MNQVSRNIALWLVVVLMALLLVNFFSRTQRSVPDKIFSEFLDDVAAGRVTSVTIRVIKSLVTRAESISVRTLPTTRIWLKPYAIRASK